MKSTKYLLILAAGVLLFAGGFILLRLITEPEGMMKALPFILIGIGCGTFGYGLGETVRIITLKKRPDLAKQLAIETNDERNQAINNLAKAKAFDITIYVFAALLLAFALMGTEMMVIIPLVVGYLFIVCFRIYYQCRLAKKM